MFIRETTSMIETHYGETYASATRTRDDIQQRLAALIDDLAPSIFTIDDLDETGWIN